MTTYTPSHTAEKPTAKSKTKARRVAKDYANPYMAGILLGVVLFAAFFITGSGLGASGGINRLLVVVEVDRVRDRIDRSNVLRRHQMQHSE